MGGRDRSLNELFDMELYNSASEPNVVRIIKSEMMN